MIPTLITWYFDSVTGKLTLDCFLKIQTQEDVPSVAGIFTRAMYTNANVALLNIPKEFGRDSLAQWMEGNKKDVLDFLKKARVTQEEILRKRKSPINSIDFIFEEG